MKFLNRDQLNQLEIKQKIDMFLLDIALIPVIIHVSWVMNFNDFVGEHYGFDGQREIPGFIDQDVSNF